MKTKQQQFILLSIFVTLSIFSNLKANATEQNDSLFKFNIYGFVRNDFAFDSRRTYAAVGELFSFLPYDTKFSINGCDENAIPSTRLLAVTSRIGFDVYSPTYTNNFNINAKIEADFCGGGTSIVFMRIRQAYTSLNWKKHSILVGQTWHPLSGEIIPHIVSLNTGTPFNPFSRAPQLRYFFKSNGFNLNAALIYQLQYNSPGPEGNSTKYQIFSGLPEFYIGTKYNYKGFEIGLGGEFMQIKPRRFGIDEENNKYKVNETVNSFVGQLHCIYTYKSFEIKAKTTLGQNMGHLLMMSGYGIDKITQTTSGKTQYHYTPFTQSATWFTASMRTNNPKHNLCATVFGGYMQNLGAKHDIIKDAYYRGFNNIDKVARVAPSVNYLYHGLQIGLEYEYTGVMYGDVNPNYTVSNTHLVNNHRIYAILVYKFNHIFTSK